MTASGGVHRGSDVKKSAANSTASYVENNRERKGVFDYYALDGDFVITGPDRGRLGGQVTVRGSLEDAFEGIVPASWAHALSQRFEAVERPPFHLDELIDRVEAVDFAVLRDWLLEDVPGGQARLREETVRLSTLTDGTGEHTRFAQFLATDLGQDVELVTFNAGGRRTVIRFFPPEADGRLVPPVLDSAGHGQGARNVDGIRNAPLTAAVNELLARAEVPAMTPAQVANAAAGLTAPGSTLEEMAEEIVSKRVAPTLASVREVRKAFNRLFLALSGNRIALARTRSEKAAGQQRALPTRLDPEEVAGFVERYRAQRPPAVDLSSPASVAQQIVRDIGGRLKDGATSGGPARRVAQDARASGSAAHPAERALALLDVPVETPGGQDVTPEARPAEPGPAAVPARSLTESLVELADGVTGRAVSAPEAMLSLNAASEALGLGDFDLPMSSALLVALGGDQERAAAQIALLCRSMDPETKLAWHDRFSEMADGRADWREPITYLQIHMLSCD